MATSKRKAPVKQSPRPPLHLVEDKAEAAEESHSAVDRAEELVDRMAHWGQRLGKSFLRVGARLKEEAEDLLAEAKSVARSRG